jgi:hypothetical protein
MLPRRRFLQFAFASIVCRNQSLIATTRPDSLYPVKACGRWGYIDRKGVVRILPRFDAAGEFSEELAPVRVAQLWGYIDKTGGIAIRPQFDEARNFRYGLSPVRVGDRWGFIRPDASYAFPTRFDVARSFQDERARTRHAEMGIHSHRRLVYHHASIPRRKSVQRRTSSCTNGRRLGISTRMALSSFARSFASPRASAKAWRPSQQDASGVL